MKPAPFKYLAPDSLEEVLALKAQYGDEAKFLAGGQSLIPTMNFRLATPEVILDINRVGDLDYIRETGDGQLRLGALARHQMLIDDPLVAEHQPLAHEAAHNVAHPQVRNRGTLCGNLAHADPASEMPAVMVAAGARLHARSTQSDRWIDAKDFYLGVFTTALDEDEMLVEVELPALQPRTGTCFLEVARRPGDYAMMGVAAMITLAEDDGCTDARLAYCGAGGTPILAIEAAGSLVGEQPGERPFEMAAKLARSEIDPSGNVNASADFQRHLAGVLTRRALKLALARVAAGATG